MENCASSPLCTKILCVIKIVLPSHTTTETAKKGVIVHTHYNFFSQLQRYFSTVLYMDNDFYKDFFRKIFVVCEGLFEDEIVHLP